MEDKTKIKTTPTSIYQQPLPKNSHQKTTEKYKQVNSTKTTNNQ